MFGNRDIQEVSRKNIVQRTTVTTVRQHNNFQQVGFSLKFCFRANFKHIILRF